MLRQNRNKSLDELLKMTNNIIEHIFNVHDDCNKDWCYEKRAFEKKLIHIPSKDHNFYFTHKDKKLHNQLTSTITKINGLAKYVFAWKVIFMAMINKLH